MINLFVIPQNWFRLAKKKPAPPSGDQWEPALFWSWDGVWTALAGETITDILLLKHYSCQLCCKSTVSLSLFVSDLSFICAPALELSLATQICVCVRLLLSLANIDSVLKLNYDLWPDLATASFIDLSIPPRQTRRRCYRKFDRDPALFCKQLHDDPTSTEAERSFLHDGKSRSSCSVALLSQQCNIHFMCLAPK